MAVEPPLLAAEQKVRARYAADACRLRTVAKIESHADRLRRHDAAELRFAREFLIPVERVWIIERHHPAADIARGTRLPQLASADALSDSVLDVAQIQGDVRVSRCCGFRHG